MKKNTEPFCSKCGRARTLNTAGQLICREWECMRANRIRGAAKAAAAVRTLAQQREESALDWFDAMCELHDIGMTVPQMHPNAGRLKAGECLYPRREVTA